MCFPVLIYNSILNFFSIFLTLELSQALSTTDSSKTVNTDKQNAIRGFRVSYKSPPPCLTQMLLAQLTWI